LLITFHCRTTASCSVILWHSASSSSRLPTKNFSTRDMISPWRETMATTINLVN
jgi:hypothetical protein